jgi:hypothetical protein
MQSEGELEQVRIMMSEGLRKLLLEGKISINTARWVLGTLDFEAASPVIAGAIGGK